MFPTRTMTRTMGVIKVSLCIPLNTGMREKKLQISESGLRAYSVHRPDGFRRAGALLVAMCLGQGWVLLTMDGSHVGWLGLRQSFCGISFLHSSVLPDMT